MVLFTGVVFFSTLLYFVEKASDEHSIDQVLFVRSGRARISVHFDPDGLLVGVGDDEHSRLRRLDPEDRPYVLSTSLLF